MNSGTSGRTSPSDSPIRSCGTPLPAGPVPGNSQGSSARDVEAAAAIAEPWKVAASAAAGPIVSYIAIIACVLAIRRFGSGPLSLVFAIGLVTPFRWTWVFPVLYLRLRGARVEWGPDEVVVGVITGIPQFLMILLGLASLVLGYWFLVAAMPRGRRVRTLVPALVGAVLGGVLWVSWVGPMVLS